MNAPAGPVATGLVLAVGHQYLDRKGNVWTVTGVHPTWRYAALARKADGEVQSYTIDGRWTRHCEWVNDLVSEVSQLAVAETAQVGL